MPFAEGSLKSEPLTTAVNGEPANFEAWTVRFGMGISWFTSASEDELKLDSASN